MRLGRRLGAASLVAVLAGAAGSVRAAEPLEVTHAEVALELNRHILEDLGIELVTEAPTGELGGFARSIYRTGGAPSLRLLAPGGSFEGLAGGVVPLRGGFELIWEGGRVSFHDFELAPADGPDLFELRAADGSAPLVLPGTPR